MPAHRSLLSALVLLAACNNDGDITSYVEPSSGTGTSTGEATTSTTSVLPTSSTSAATESSSGPDPSTTTTSAGTSSSSTEGTSEPASTTEPPPPSCGDGVVNQDETDVDCGGSCSPCLDGQVCAAPGDCASTLCEAGVCVPPECAVDEDCASFGGPCVVATCDAEAKKCAVEVLPDGLSCDDGDLCTTIAGCVAGECVGGVPIDCSMLDTACGLGTCAPQTGKCSVSPKPDMEGKPCDDGYACTPADVCAEGVCGPGYPGYAFFDDFADPDPGWLLGATWQIGPAKASKKGGTGGSDPAADHTSTDDERLAGVVIGGLSEGPAQAKTCLTTPAIDTTLGKEAWVTFWRHLHTDFFPFVVNQIEVFDGVDWVEVVLGYDSPGVDDKNWQQLYHDLSEYSNEALRVRFCYQRTDGADTFAGWSIDDVTVGPYVCTPE